MPQSPHTFHIPVMGTGFTIDTPLKVARYGVDSVISVVDDHLIEKMRKFHSEQFGLPYAPISPGIDDFRAKRITAYLNLVHDRVQRQIEAIRNCEFNPGSEIERYFELLPDGPVRHLYDEMVVCADPERKTRLQEQLRGLIRPGSIDVNIMTKIDRARPDRKGNPRPPEYSDAKSGLRGFALSNLEGGVVFSAGMNQGLYAYASEFEDFYPLPSGHPKKKIILKVSDYRSALIQGKFLAKKGLWISEFRIESGLNCGGHAFATKGHVAGPILEEFLANRDSLTQQLHEIYSKALKNAGRHTPTSPLPVRITYQGGIGTAEEDRLLREYYGVDGTGWGTPFLLVPEVCNVDDIHLGRLCEASGNDIQLTRCSPLGVPFWNLRTSGSETFRRERIDGGNPGSPCPKKFLVSSDEYSENLLCLGAEDYQERKVAQLRKDTQLDDATRDEMIHETLEKACLCRDLAGGAMIRNGIDLKATPAICCGPNMAYFDKQLSFREMVDRIYGRCSMEVSSDRPHFLLKEIELYIEFMTDETRREGLGLVKYPDGYFTEYLDNLENALNDYMEKADKLSTDPIRFRDQCAIVREQIEIVRAGGNPVSSSVGVGRP